MARWSRIWRVLKWAGAGASVILLVAAVGSGWFALRASYGCSCSLADGSLYISYVPGGWFDASFDLRQSTTAHWRWALPAVESSTLNTVGPGGTPVPTTATIWYVTIPLWLPLLLMAAPTSVACFRDWWRRYRLTPPGHCPNCGYNLTGNTSGRCPECGAPTPKAGADAQVSN
jgi:hypothetical protein